MPLPTGIWTMVTNGRIRTLEIRDVDERGRVQAVMQSTAALLAYWSEASGLLTMKRIVVPGNSLRQEDYIGYLHDIAEDSIFFNLAGTCTAIDDTDNGAPSLGDRRVFGWFARLPREERDESTL